MLLILRTLLEWAYAVGWFFVCGGARFAEKNSLILEKERSSFGNRLDFMQNWSLKGITSIRGGSDRWEEGDESY